MAKTNFTKVEEALNEGLRRMNANKLLEEADRAKAKAAGQLTEEELSHDADKQLLTILHNEIKHLYRAGHNPYEQLGITKQLMKHYCTSPESLTLDDWKKIKQLKQKVDALKKELEKLPQETNDSIVEKERRSQINKRFNIKDNWLPLA